MEGRKPLAAMQEATHRAAPEPARQLPATPSRPDLLYRPIVFQMPELQSELSAWTEHTPFAFWIVEALRPQSLVELGTHAGVSYCAFCQAVKALGLATAAYAVDTWQGDAHTNKSDAAYADDVLGELRRHHDPRYGGFSTLVQSTFENAVPSFADGSIDLLHIDGYHTYEAVRGDFETWAPKLSERAVVLFHDINERKGDFGAWRLWEEISARHPSFHFLHGHGLGVLAVGREQTEAIRWLTSLDAADQAIVRSFFAGRGHAVQVEVNLQRSERRARTAQDHADNLQHDLDAAAARQKELAERSRLELEDAFRKLHEANLATQKVNEEAIWRQGVIDEAQKRIATLDGEIKAKAEHVGALDGEIKAKAEHVGALVAQVRFLEHRIRGFETSTSWRLTRPVRWLGRSLGRARRLLRWQRHRLDLVRCPPVEITDTPQGHSDWYEVGSSRGSLPTRLVSFSYLGPRYDGTVFLTLFVDQGDGRWQPLGLPSITGTLVNHLLRLPDSVAALRIKVQASREHLSSPPVLGLREVGQAELAARAVWRNRERLPNALRYLARNGVSATLARATEAYGLQNADLYHRWIEAYELSGADRAAIVAHIASLRTRPLISVLVPVYNTPERYLRAMLDSMLNQLYPHWELCIADDASTEPHVRPVLEEYAGRDSRVKVVFHEQNGHISAASNSALDLATGSHLALLDHDDLLAEHALYITAVAINDHPEAEIFYSDEDKIDDLDRRTEPYFKPDFGFDLLLGQNYVSHLGVYRLDTVRSVGGFRLGFEGSQDYDLVLRILTATGGAVVHMPWILYHWRLFPGAGTFSSTQIDKAAEAARRALREHLVGKGIAAKVEPWVHAYHKVVRDDLPFWPRVSLIVPTRDHLGVLKTCVEGVLERTDYPDIELVIANNDSAEPETLAYFDKLRGDARVRIVDCPGAFNFSAINNAAVRASTGDVVVLLNNDVEVIDGGWLKEMVKHALRSEVGAVGAKLLYPDNTIQHGSVVLGLNGVAGHLHVGVPHDSPGYFGWLKIAHNVSAATAACLAMRRSVFDEVGGLDEVNLKVAFNDVDLCLKVTERNYQIIWTPEATLYHWESKSRGNDLSSQHLARFQSEVAHMRQRWGARLDNDPFFNPNLSLSTAHPVVAFPPRVERPWRAFLAPSTAAA
jgi:glycosyltransferase involved in cell wall biosynthesis